VKCLCTLSYRLIYLYCTNLSKTIEIDDMMHGWGVGGVGGGFPGFHQRPQRFEETYHCYSVAFADKPHLEVRSARIRLKHE
jgi:hypothetical protein